MSPLFNHILKQGENLFEAHNDDPKGSYYPTNQQQNMAFFEALKAQKTARTMNTATEIPHLYVDERNVPAANPTNNANQMSPFDPLLLQLIQWSMVNRQQNEIVRQQQMIQQQLQQSKFPSNQPNQPQIQPQTQQQAFVLPQNSAQSLKAGETMVIGEQTYMAVQLNDVNGTPSIGLVPAQPSIHTVTALPPMMNNNWNSQQTQHYGPNAGMSFNGYGIPNYGQFPNQESVRYHPGKRMEMASQVPLFINGIPLPHEICRSHLMDPFVWART